MSELLDSIEEPQDLRKLNLRQLQKLAGEIRQLIIQVVARNGGHLSSNLGVVELTIALHYVFDFLKDRLVWDVGHQGYAHKILTGRREEFPTLRQKGGLSGFVDRSESPYDLFSFGHTATSISAGLGLAASQQGEEEARVVAVVGDGAIASGMAFEALNHAAEIKGDLLVVLNDNEMSISPSVGGVARYLSKIRSSTPYVDLKREVQEVLSRWKRVFEGVDRLYGRLSEGLKTALTPGGLFVEMGFEYYGPVDGHDLGELVGALRQVRRIGGPVLLHVITEKGKGFEPASSDPTGFHSSGRFEMDNGKICELPPSEEEGEAEPQAEERSRGGRSWSEAMGDALERLAQDEPRLVAITAAMCHGTGLARFAEQHPGRFYDVGICEQHGVGFAGGLAAGGMKPVACIYSTFLQRAVDQVFHDVALQRAPIVFGVDRAGLVGNDGPTHHGLYDIAYLRPFPGMMVMAPADAEELEQMLRLAVRSDRPCAIRYPRENVPAEACAGERELEPGRAAVLRRGADAAILAYGALVSRAREAARMLAEEGTDVTVVNLRFAKPLDREAVLEAARSHETVLVAEDHSEAGGVGSAVLEALAGYGEATAKVSLAGVPDRFIAHAPRGDQLAQLRLDAEGLAGRVRQMLPG